MRLRFFTIAIVTLAAFGAFACSGSTSSKPATREEGRFGGAALPPDDGSQEGCSEAAKFVYVVSAENTLYRFAPDELTFTEVGPLRCPAGAATPNSMAIDRAGVAWINFSDGSLFKVSTEDARCEKTRFLSGQHGFVRFGMAFAADSAGSSKETLFVSGVAVGGGGDALASIDLDTFMLTPIGDFHGALEGMHAELTGSGDGRLYGFFTTSPTATLAEIDKTSAATSNRRILTGVNTGVAWAFSFWGGDFWFYTSPGTTPSSVTRLAMSERARPTTVKKSVGSVGRIVGAGVSTCAPATSPK